MSDQMTNKDVQLDVRYGQPAALYTSQFLLNAGPEEMTLDCTSGIEQPAGEATVVPVHTRLAMSWAAAERLASLLNQALAQREPAKTHIPAPHFETDAAKLPSFGQGIG